MYEGFGLMECGSDCVAAYDGCVESLEVKSRFMPMPAHVPRAAKRAAIAKKARGERVRNQWIAASANAKGKRSRPPPGWTRAPKLAGVRKPIEFQPFEKKDWE